LRAHEPCPAHRTESFLGQRHGRPVQVDPINLTLEPPITIRLNSKYIGLLSNVAFEFDLRRYVTAFSDNFGGACSSCSADMKCGPNNGGRGLHSFTFQLNVSAFCGIGGALRVCSELILRVFGRCRGVLWGVEGLKGVFRVRYGSG